MSTSRRVAKNSLWYGIELGFGVVLTFATSVLLARTYGPVNLAEYNILVWLTYVAGALATVGLPAATLKYVSEYLGKQQPGMAYHIYLTNFRLQAKLAAVMVAAGLVYVWLAVPPDYQWPGFWLVLAIGPRMLGFIPAQINSATEEMHRNLPSSFASTIVSLVIIFATVHFNWGILGLALSHPISQTLDLVLKLVMTRRRREEWRAAATATGAAIDGELARRMRTFAHQGLGLMVLNLVVWDRSDLFFLKWLNPDLSQVTFFNYSFTLVEKLLLIPQVLGGGLGLNLMAQQGRERQRLATMTISSATYLLLVGVPVMLGAAALSRPLWMIYGEKFAPAVPVFIIMALLAIPRMVLYATNVFLQATENQRFSLLWGCVCGAIKVGLDIWLIPSLGAVGAAIGNGAGQTLAAAGAFVFIVRAYSPEVPYGRLLRILLSAAIMAISSAGVTLWLPPVPGALAGFAAGVLVYLLLLRLTRALGEEDRNRLLSLTSAFPPPLRYPCNRILWSLIPLTR
jgi:O-antigen/teichoic acid export membrane protein